MPSYLAQVVQEPVASFWPTEAGSWFALIAGGLGMAVMLGGWIYQAGRFRQALADEEKRTDAAIAQLRIERDAKLERMQERFEAKFKEHGERIGLVGDGCSEHSGRFEEISTKLTEQGLELSGTTRDAGALRADIKRLEKDLKDLDDRQRADDRWARDNVVEIKAAVFPRSQDRTKP